MKERWHLDALKDQLDYNPETGALTWKDSPAVDLRHRGRPVVLWLRDGALWFDKFRCQWSAHRVCWMVHYGAWPQHNISHKNGDKSDNRIANLVKYKPPGKGRKKDPRSIVETTTEEAAVASARRRKEAREAAARGADATLPDPGW